MNDADTLGYLLLTSYMAGTTSQPRMRNSAKLVSSLRQQGVGGLSEVSTAGQGARGSLGMWSIMLMSRSLGVPAELLINALKTTKTKKLKNL